MHYDNDDAGKLGQAVTSLLISLKALKFFGRIYLSYICACTFFCRVEKI